MLPTSCRPSRLRTRLHNSQASAASQACASRQPLTCPHACREGCGTARMAAGPASFTLLIEPDTHAVVIPELDLTRALLGLLATLHGGVRPLHMLGCCRACGESRASEAGALHGEGLTASLAALLQGSSLLLAAWVQQTAMHAWPGAESRARRLPGLLLLLPMRHVAGGGASSCSPACVLAEGLSWVVPPGMQDPPAVLTSSA